MYILYIYIYIHIYIYIYIYIIYAYYYIYIGIIGINNRYQLPNYVSVHQVRKNVKTGGSITTLIHKELIYNNS